MDESAYLPVSWPKTWQSKLTHVHALTTLRNCTGDTHATCSNGYSAFNLATHVDDDLKSVLSNRDKLRADCKLPSTPNWLEQVHSNKVIGVDVNALTDHQIIPQADASFTKTKGAVCVVLTADCLPVFFCNHKGTEVAVAHAGWRGLHAGIISNTIAEMASPADEILVSLGPAIGPLAFEVGEDVFQAFTDLNTSNASAFTKTANGRYLCDMYQLARIELESLGINQVSGGERCTYHDEQHFYSFRRQQITGRMANLIWFD